MLFFISSNRSSLSCIVGFFNFMLTVCYFVCLSAFLYRMPHVNPLNVIRPSTCLRYKSSIILKRCIYIPISFAVRFVGSKLAPSSQYKMIYTILKSIREYTFLILPQLECTNFEPYCTTRVHALCYLYTQIMS